jgi:hypothetical protein
MNTELLDIVDAILRNNPSAVSEKLSQLGVINGLYLDPDYLKQIMIEEIAYMNDNDSVNFVANVLDVPIDPDGSDADYLKILGGETNDQGRFKANRGSGFFNDYIQKNETLVTFALVILIIFLFTGVIYLIRKF